MTKHETVKELPDTEQPDVYKRQEMEHLIEELLTCENPYQCPHGRPTIISMSRYELEKKFKRIV